MKLLNLLIAGIISILPRFLIKPFAKPYVAGETISDVIQQTKVLSNNGVSATIDILGEHVKTKHEAKTITQSYIDLLTAIYNAKFDCHISIKPTHIGMDVSYETARDNLFILLEKGKKFGNFIRIDMENSPYTDATIKLVLEAQTVFSNVGFVIQSYLRRSSKDIERLNGQSFNVRICKGIYRESEDIAFQNKTDINDHYIQLVKSVLSGKGYVAIATHDISLINILESWIAANKISKNRFEFQFLYGVPMSGKLEQLLEKGYLVRVYVPFGKDWHDYAVRRLKENPKIISYVLKNMVRKN